jgi:tripartite-type tricarboxylate transporter receptor subunit TctC
MWIARCLTALWVLVAFIAPAASEEYPTRPIRVIVPTAPGGMADILARSFGQKFGEKIKQPVIVENRAGAGGAIAADFVAKSPADGYTLYLGFHATNSILPTLDPKLPYNAAKDFAPIITSPTCRTCWWSIPRSRRSRSRSWSTSPARSRAP